jgi:glutamate--cysteine ligase
MSLLGSGELRDDVVSLFSPAHPPVRPGTVGVEIELIPVAAGGVSPVPLEDTGHGSTSLVGFLHEYGRRTERVAADWDQYGSASFRTSREGRLVFEPGGQLEYSTLPRRTARRAADDVRQTLAPLRKAARDAGIHLIARGLNPWHTAEEVGLQLATPRYRAMDRYFARLGPFGQQMMRLSASMQVNLDFGSPAEARSRWRAANLLAPVCAAAFANSPASLPDGTMAVSGRSAIWQRLDTSRTGLVLASGPAAAADPWGQYLVFALTARVMLRVDADAGVRSETADIRFNEWWAGAAGSPPTAEEWRIHLTTLFPGVRPRGWLELRTIDVPGEEWWAVPLTLLPALLYDQTALNAILEVLEPHGGTIADLSRRAALAGLRDPVLGELAETAFRLALASADRFPRGYFGEDMIAATRRYFDRFVRPRVMQADEDGETDTIA